MSNVSQEELLTRQLRNGIINMSITLCENLMTMMSVAEAKTKTAEFLETVAESIRSTVNIDAKSKEEQLDTYIKFQNEDN